LADNNAASINLTHDCDAEEQRHEEVGQTTNLHGLPQCPCVVGDGFGLKRNGKKEKEDASVAREASREACREAREEEGKRGKREARQARERQAERKER
jgi:hypothetical protein